MIPPLNSQVVHRRFLLPLVLILNIIITATGSIFSHEPRKNNPPTFPLYWLVNRDPYKGF